MAEVKNITTENFDESINEGVTLVDFWGPGCPPCVVQGPILDRVAQQLGDKASICKLNVQENMEIAAQYRISGVPTLIVFKDSAPIKQFVGLQSEDALVSELEAQL